MRVLLLLRGSAGCGKSTWIEQNGLKPYTLCADDIRLLCSSPIMNVSGGEEISQSNDNTVWSILFKLLEHRMQNGEFTVIDATNSKTSEMNRYKELCSSYKYRIYCVDFTDIPIDVVKERNRNRLPELKRVPDFVIDKMYSRFQTQKIPSGITVIRPDELDKIWFKPIDLSEYKKVHHIGDIHGCYTALKGYFDNDGGLKDDEFYIFTGDYIDRGIENAEVVNFLISIYTKPNVLLLEGNHERWLWIWANEGVCESKEFELKTRYQLNKGGVSKKDVRQLYRRLGQCAYYKYGDKIFLVTHGGLSTVPSNITCVATSQMIKGVGNYNDVETVAETFAANTPDNYIQIHGHRNTKSLPIQVNQKVFNLEGKIETGGYLRCVRFDKDGTLECVETQNTIFEEVEVVPESIENEQILIGNMIIALRKNRFVQEKCFGNISSFNFTRQAFYDKVWDEQTTKARGLYINVPKQKIVARAYEKFFNINERPETKFDMLERRFAFPVTAYVKENGFLGIVSYNEETDALFVTTKSAPTGDFARWLKKMINEKLSNETQKKMKQFSKEHNVSFVFECVDMENDPHIIDYPKNELFLLDIVYNDLEFKKFEYTEIVKIANEFGLKHKTLAYVIENWSDFFDWYYQVTSEDYEYDGRKIEGFVIEDTNGYMVKLKLHYYNFWKFMRSISHETLRNGYLNPKRMSALTSPLANQYYSWVKTLYKPRDKTKYHWWKFWKKTNVSKQDNTPRDICTLRKMFYQSDAGRLFMNE